MAEMAREEAEEAEVAEMAREEVEEAEVAEVVAKEKEEEAADVGKGAVEMEVSVKS